MSVKKYIVELSDEERAACTRVAEKLKGTSQKVKRANILLKSDQGWTDEKIADAFNCRRQTVENVRKRLVECGFEQTLNGKKRAQPPVQKLLDADQEAKVIAMRLGDPPKGFGKWTLRLLARKVVELEIVEQVSHQTIRRMLKKTR